MSDGDDGERGKEASKLISVPQQGLMAAPGGTQTGLQKLRSTATPKHVVVQPKHRHIPLFIA